MRKFLAVLALIFGWCAAHAQPAGEIPGFAPFSTGALDAKYPATKAIFIQVGGSNQAVCFDTELCRMAMGWTGGFLRASKSADANDSLSEPVGTPVFVTPVAPGWAREGSFTDPRPQIEAASDRKPTRRKRKVTGGNLPDDWAHYRGFFVNGNRVILSYSVAQRSVLEMPGFEPAGDLPIFSRTFEVEGAWQSTQLLVCEARGGTVQKAENYICVSEGNTFTAVGIVRSPKGATFEMKEGSIILKMPRAVRRQNFKLLISSGNKSDFINFMAALEQSPAVQDLKSLCKGGKSRWRRAVQTSGIPGKNGGAFQVDTIALPQKNPWNRPVRPSGLDFFADGSAAVCSLNGDVWIARGLDSNLEKISWTRFAGGLFQPRGLKIVKGRIYVVSRDSIVALHDVNGDGEADFYENFNSDVVINLNSNEFCHALETDSKGDFYFLKSSQSRQANFQDAGALFKLPSNGKKLEIICNNLLAPSGLVVGPEDEIVIAENDRSTAAARLNLVDPGSFYRRVFAGSDKSRADCDNPVLFLAQKGKTSGSSDGLAWITSEQWGGLAGNLLHSPAETKSVFEVMLENVNDTVQAAAVKVPFGLKAEFARGRFNPQDGQFYLLGSPDEATFQRVRYTGKSVHLPVELHVKPAGLEIQFSEALNPVSAADVKNYSVEQRNLKTASDSVKNSRADFQKVKVTSATLSDDRRSVLLQIPGLKPVAQMKIRYVIRAADGAQLDQEIFNSILEIPAAEKRISR